MNKKRVLVIGASGLVGSYLYYTFKSGYLVWGTYYHNQIDPLISLDITNKDQIKKVINQIKPNIIIVPVAIPNVELCESDPKLTLETNIQGIKNVIKEIENKRIKFIFLSSEYVFDGQDGPYSENDIPNPLNEYGKQKLEIEKYILKHLKDFIIVRTTVIYGWEKKEKNFIVNLIKKLSKKEKIFVPYDQKSSPTYVLDLAQAIKKLVEKDQKGIYNIVGSEVIDRYHFAMKAAEVFELDKSLIQKISTDCLMQKAKRPLNAGLIINKINNLGIQMSNAKDGLIKMKKQKDILGKLL